MTPAERADVSLLNGSRRARIAKGSGTTVAEVNSLVKRFEGAKAMMSQMGQMGGGMPGLGGMPAMGGKAKQKANARAEAQRKARIKKKARSGNPAKRRQQELEAMLPREQRGGGAAAGSAFGVTGSQADMPRPTMDDLPEDIRRMLSGM